MLRIPSDVQSIELRELTEADAEVYFESYQASRNEIARFDADASTKHTSVDVTRETLGDGKKLRLGIFKDAVFTGSINMRVAESEAEIGCWVDSRHTGNDYATIATMALTKYAVDQGKFRKVYAEVLSDNHASMRVLEKVGYTKIAENLGTLIFEADLKPSDYDELRFKQRLIKRMKADYPELYEDKLRKGRFDDPMAITPLWLIMEALDAGERARKAHGL